MIVLVSTSDPQGADELRDLRAELISEAAWRGRVELVEQPPAPGRLGPVLDALQLALEPGNIAPLLAALAAWLRYRTSDVELTVRRTDDGSTVTVSGRRVRQLDVVALTAQVEEMTERLTDSDRHNVGG
ncbi:hypothetical protein ACIBAG_01980 [Streptomyces sp. NPDC051243]|uniref:effector-associated constant component EACC1 n=1 Tax=Streptomyces sp. NPDC051243 TaxID=3365646 RepID=UPI0037B5F186